MKRDALIPLALLALIAVVVAWRLPAGTGVSAQQTQNLNVPKIPFESVPDYLNNPATMNLGEVLGVAVNSKGHVLVLNHPGQRHFGPGLRQCDHTAAGVRRTASSCGRSATASTGWHAHGVRYDKYDNLWVVDKGAHAVMRFNPAGYVTLNLGRRPEGPDDPERTLLPRPGAAHPARPPSARRRQVPRADRYRVGLATTTFTSATAT